MYAQSQQKSGFTLIELLLYVGITGVMLLVISVFLAMLLQVRVKNTTIAEVDQQGQEILHVLTQTIRNAESITSPSIGTSASSLTLDVYMASDDPTVFNLSSGVFQITEGAGSAISLSNSRVTISGLTFENVSRSATPGIIQIEFTVTHSNPEGRNEYDYAKTFYGSAAVRHP